MKVYTGTLLGPEGETVGRWIKYEDWCNEASAQAQNQQSPYGQNQNATVQNQAQRLANDQEEGLRNRILPNG